MKLHILACKSPKKTKNIKYITTTNLYKNINSTLKKDSYAIVVYNRNLELIIFSKLSKRFLLLSATIFLEKYRSVISNYVKNNWKPFFTIFFISLTFKAIIRHFFHGFGFDSISLFLSFGLLFALFRLIRSGFKDTEHNFSVKSFVFSFFYGTFIAYFIQKLGSCFDPALFALFISIYPGYIEKFVFLSQDNYMDKSASRLNNNIDKTVYRPNLANKKYFLSSCPVEGNSSENNSSREGSELLDPVEGNSRWYNSWRHNSLREGSEQLAPVEGNTSGNNNSRQGSEQLVPVVVNTNVTNSPTQGSEQSDWIKKIVNDPDVPTLVSLMEPISPVPLSSTSASLRSSQIHSNSDISDLLQKAKLDGAGSLPVSNSKQWDAILKCELSDLCFRYTLPALSSNELTVANNSLMKRITVVIKDNPNLDVLNQPISKVHTGTSSTRVDEGSESNYLGTILRYMPFNRKKESLMEPTVSDWVIHWGGIIKKPFYIDLDRNSMEDHKVRRVCEAFLDFFDSVSVPNKNSPESAFTYKDIVISNANSAKKFNTLLKVLEEGKIRINHNYILDQNNVRPVLMQMRSDVQEALSTLDNKKKIWLKIIEVLGSNGTEARQGIEQRIEEYSLTSPKMPKVEGKSILTDPGLLPNFRRP